MHSSTVDQVTTVLLEPDTSRARLDQLLSLIYDDLRAIAHRELGRGDWRHTLSTTALVHEAYLRLADDDRVTARGRAYFFAAAARAMRRIVVERARWRQRLKRGGGVPPLPLDEATALMDGTEIDVLDLERGLSELGAIAERPARVVECRFFAGLSVEDTALALGVTTRTIKRDWAFARVWLFDFLHPRDPETEA
jgi:RNA polymerase sigma-70 factor, ECF subfamily